MGLVFAFDSPAPCLVYQFLLVSHYCCRKALTDRLKQPTGFQRLKFTAKAESGSFWKALGKNVFLLLPGLGALSEDAAIPCVASGTALTSAFISRYPPALPCMCGYVRISLPMKTHWIYAYHNPAWLILT